MVKHIVRRDSGKADANIMHPMREWASGLLVVGLMVLWGVIFTIALYRVYGNSLETQVPVVATPIPYKAALVSSTIQYYEKERAAYEAMLGTESLVGKSTPVATTTVGDAGASSTSVTATATTTPDVAPIPKPVVKETVKPMTPVPAL